MADVVFLKLGGSLITDKARPRALRSDLLERVSREIAEAVARRGSELQLLLGHGSGSFGHVEARKHGTGRGVRTPAEWQGFAEVWSAAAALNRIVVDELRRAGLPAMAFPPSAGAVARDGLVLRYEAAPIQAALEHGLLPVVYGDVAVDEVRGGTILSTEDLFRHLAESFGSTHILLAGIEAGVYADYPQGRTVIPELTPGNLETYRRGLGESAGTDVTGGMLSKVTAMLSLTELRPGLSVWIFSGLRPGAVRDALLNPNGIDGTCIRSRGQNVRGWRSGG